MLPDNGIVTTKAEVLKEWIDSNEHMNVAYYLVVFDKGFDKYKDLIGMDINYIKKHQCSTVSLEAHICYHAEAMLGDKLRVETRIVDFDSKRAHVYQEMYNENLLLATQETLSISFDMNKRKTCNFDPRFNEHYKFLCDTQKLTKIRGVLGKSIKISNSK
jgi:acyl-CoA thioester hydrolase